MRFLTISYLAICATIATASVSPIKERQVSCVVDGQTVFGDCECGCNIVSTGVETPPFCQGNGFAPCDDCAVSFFGGPGPFSNEICCTTECISGTFPNSECAC